MKSKRFGARMEAAAREREAMKKAEDARRTEEQKSAAEARAAAEKRRAKEAAAAKVEAARVGKGRKATTELRTAFWACTDSEPVQARMRAEQKAACFNKTKDAFAECYGHARNYEERHKCSTDFDDGYRACTEEAERLDRSAKAAGCNEEAAALEAACTANKLDTGGRGADGDNCYRRD